MMRYVTGVDLQQNYFSSSTGRSNSASDYSDFKGATRGAAIGDLKQPFSEVHPWCFEPPARSRETPERVENPERRRRHGELDSEEWLVWRPVRAVSFLKCTLLLIILCTSFENFCTPESSLNMLLFDGWLLQCLL